jgi:hypothetical protein
MLAAMADTSTGTLQHPVLGNITCKPHTFETDWKGATREGVPCSASWLETTEDPNSLALLIASVSPMAAGLQASADIDKHLPNLTPPLPALPQYQPNFQDAMRSIQGVFDQVSLLQQRGAGVINNILYRVNAIQNAMATAARLPGGAQNSALAWPMRDALQRMTAAANDLKKTLLVGKKSIGIYMPARNATMGKLAADIPAPITDLLVLNPSLVASPIVKANSKIRYYLPAAA